jgi:tRNA A37 threonylcarbamoyladenosine dehydratase
MMDREVDLERRFGGIIRLYGEKKFRLIQNCHVCVVGIGGVGSWVVESLVRHGVGKITLIDMDHIVESNINRQIHALDSTDGESKIKAMKIESLISIQPVWWIVLMIF